MADSVTRPVYVPRRKRQNQQSSLFHGAFTGGFSAGHNNTVGSAEGWAPSTERNRVRAGDTTTNNTNYDNNIETAKRQSKKDRNRLKRQRIEDYMDDQDHNEWGGPLYVKKDYKTEIDIKSKTNSSTESTGVDTNSEDVFETILDVKGPSSNIGHRLLRQLGWRGHNFAYAAISNDDDEKYDYNGGDDGIEQRLFLSGRNLRKIKLRTRIQIPEPIFDIGGLGYSAFENAPEFQAVKNRRVELAKERTQVNESINNRNRNVYRLSNILDPFIDGDEDDINNNLKSRESNHDAIAYQESIDDFIGTKTSGGFALRDDDDDGIYDDNKLATLADTRTLLSTSGGTRTSTALVVRSTNNEEETKKRPHINTEEYNLVAFEAHDSDPEDNTDQMGIPTKAKSMQQRNDRSKIGVDFGSLLSSWIQKGEIRNGKHGNSSLEPLTSDGRSLIAGFILGSNGPLSGVPHNYRGPDIPSLYRFEPHKFGQDEHPPTIQALSENEQIATISEKRKTALKKVLAKNDDLKGSTKQQSTTAIQPQSIIPKSVLQRSRAFEGISRSMNERFTTGTASSAHSTIHRTEVSLPAGLAQPKDILSLKESKKRLEQFRISATKNDAKYKSEITIKRTTIQFAPKPFLCKRFRINSNCQQAVAASDTGTKSRTLEETYFNDEILKRVNTASENPDRESEMRTKSDVTDEMYREQARRILQDILSDLPSYKTDEERPSMSVYKSIFNEAEAVSDDGSDVDVEDGENMESKSNVEEIAFPMSKGAKNSVSDQINFALEQQFPAETMMTSLEKNQSRKLVKSQDAKKTRSLSIDSINCHSIHSYSTRDDDSSGNDSIHSCKNKDESKKVKRQHRTKLKWKKNRDREHGKKKKKPKKKKKSKN